MVSEQCSILNFNDFAGMKNILFDLLGCLRLVLNNKYKTK